MSKSIKLRNNVYLLVDSIAINKYWYLRDFITGVSGASSSNNSNVWDKLITFTLVGNYPRQYANILLVDQEGGSLISELSIFIRKGDDSSGLQTLICKQKKHQDNGNLVPYAYLTKNNASTVVVEIWVHVKAQWKTPYYFLRSSYINHVQKTTLQQTVEPSGTKYDFSVI